MGTPRVGFSLFGPGLAEPVSEQVEMHVDPDMNFDDWRTGPLRMAVIEPHKRVDLSWDGARIKFDGRYEAMYPAHAFSSHPSGSPPYYGDDRTEQHGRVTADLAVDGKKLPEQRWCSPYRRCRSRWRSNSSPTNSEFST